MLQFAPTYHDYVLYSDGSQEVPTKYRVRTFVPTGQEMETLRKHKQMFGAGKLDDTYTSGTSSADPENHAAEAKGRDAMQNPLLFDPHNPFSTVYDMSPIDGAGHVVRGRPPLPESRLNDFDRRRSSAIGNEDSRRTSLGDEALETTRLAPGRRRSSQGVLADETDSYGEQDQFVEGYIQR